MYNVIIFHAPTNSITIFIQGYVCNYIHVTVANLMPVYIFYSNTILDAIHEVTY